MFLVADNSHLSAFFSSFISCNCVSHSFLVSSFTYSLSHLLFVLSGDQFIYFFSSNHLVFFIRHFTVSFSLTFCSSTLNHFLLFSTTIVFIFYTLISFLSFVVFFYPLYFAICALLFSILSSFIFLYFS